MVKSKITMINDIFERFIEEDVDFCIFRNYTDLEKEKDVDLLIYPKSQRLC